jgi:hypothetical protein
MVNERVRTLLLHTSSRRIERLRRREELLAKKLEKAEVDFQEKKKERTQKKEKDVEKEKETSSIKTLT